LNSDSDMRKVSLGLYPIFYGIVRGATFAQLYPRVKVKVERIK
jgi:hypothetical protein